MDTEAKGTTAAAAPSLAAIRAPVSTDEYEPSTISSSTSHTGESEDGYETASDSEEDNNTAAAPAMPKAKVTGDDEVPDEEEEVEEEEEGEGDEPEAVARVPDVSNGDDVSPNVAKPDENGVADDFEEKGEQTKAVEEDKSDGEKSAELGELSSGVNIEESAESKPLEASNASDETKEPENVEASSLEAVENGGPENTEGVSVAEHVGGERDGASELPNDDATRESVGIEGLDASAIEKDDEPKVGYEAEIPNAEAARECVETEGTDASAVEQPKAVDVPEASVEADKDDESKAVEVPEASVEAEKEKELKAVDVPEASAEADNDQESKALDVLQASVMSENDERSKGVEVPEASVEPEKGEAVVVDNTSSSEKEDSSKPVEEPPKADQNEAVEADDVAQYEQKHIFEDVDEFEAKPDAASGGEASLTLEGAGKDVSLTESSPLMEETKNVADADSEGDSNTVQVQENENVEGQETPFPSVVRYADAGAETSADGEEKITAQDDDDEPVVAEVSSENENDSLEVNGESPSGASFADRDVKPDDDVPNAVTDGENVAQDEEDEEEVGTADNGPARVAILESSEAAKQIIKELEEGSSGDHSTFDGSRDVDGQIVTDSDEDVDTDEEGDGKEFDSAALAALLKAAAGVSSDSNSIGSADTSRIFSVDRPAGLGSSAPSLKPGPARSARPNLFAPADLAVPGEAENSMDEEERKLHEKVEQIRVKFLRLVQRLGHSPEDTVAAQVLYRLSLAEGIRRGRQISRAFSLENAKKKALQLEVDGEEDLDFCCNILVVGKTGVGKSATINSIFGMEKSNTNAFELSTTSVREISGVVDGVKIRIVDTPGLRPSVMDQASNRKILSNIKKYTKRCPPDIVLYVDRLDTQTRDFNDLPLLKTITSTLGSSIWFNAIVALTHGASAPPDGPNGSPLSYDVFIAQRSHVVQQSIRQAAGDMRLMNPVALVENHPSCRRNRGGQKILPNGLSWRPQMLLLCYSSKILSEANALLKLQDPSPGKLFGLRLRSPPLPFLLSSLLQSRQHPKLSNDQGIDNGDSDIDLDDLSDADQGEDEDDDYDSLPPFKPLKKSQIAKLSKEQRKAYYEEYDYRVKLLQQKQWKEEIRRLKEMKKRGKTTEDNSPFGDMADDFDQDGAPAAVPVPLPDMVLPPSFDCDNPAYRYRFLEPTSQLLTRPVLDTHGWDHDCGYDGVSLEESLALAGRFPASLAVQITKDKKEFNIHLDSSISAKHGDKGSTLAGFDIQSVGRQLAYILRSETKFKNMKKNKSTAGMSVTFLGETVATGLKVEDKITLGKRVSLVASTGAVRAQGDTAYGANLEARLREKDYPIGQVLSTLGLSLMRWRGDLALGANLQSQFSVGRNSKIAVRAGLNNKLSGQITVKTSTSEQLQIALVGLLPVAVSIFRNIWPNEAYVVN